MPLKLISVHEMENTLADLKLLHDYQLYHLKTQAKENRDSTLQLSPRTRSSIPSSEPQPLVLLQGVPRNAIFLDIERFLSACEYDAFSIQFFLRVGFPDKMAIVRFPLQTQAMNCFITRNKDFCLNNRIFVRTLQ
ncbi:hypothetical protein TorRG33x02_063060 [Trema orientale]|uniref:Uncharacterized protein n=1 Tax=Trema orientale TaxID=63057 RepID=A0A2P5FJL4_TREOI|nr:hypothetical protein TorRG33x02_063060 [Trema orientale]